MPVRAAVEVLAAHARPTGEATSWTHERINAWMPDFYAEPRYRRLPAAVVFPYPMRASDGTPIGTLRRDAEQLVVRLPR